MGLEERRRAIIGGTGFSERARDLETIATDYGDVQFGHLQLGGKDVVFLARHKRLQIPSHVNYRANVQALKLLGVNAVYTVSASGRAAENVLPGHLVNLSDLVFMSTGVRETTFAEDGALILHTPLAGIFSGGMRETINEAWEIAKPKVERLYADTPGLNVGFHPEGVYFNSEPPWFNTPAQEAWLRNTIPGLKLLGQTKIPESALLREMGIAEASIGACTDHSNFPGAVRVTHAGEGGVMDVAAITAQASFFVLDEAIRLLPDEFYDELAHNSLRQSVSPTQVNLPLLKERRPKLAVIIEDTLAS
jgi:purine nucleoside phosphorylase